MSAHITNKRVPEDLAGTRQGLFHILLGNSAVPQDDPMASSEITSVTAQGNPTSGGTAMQPSLHPKKSYHEQLADFLQKDEFCF